MRFDREIIIKNKKITLLSTKSIQDELIKNKNDIDCYIKIIKLRIDKKRKNHYSIQYIIKNSVPTKRRCTHS